MIHNKERGMILNWARQLVCIMNIALISVAMSFCVDASAQNIEDDSLKSSIEAEFILDSTQLYVIDELVVVGYGVSRKSVLTGANSSLSAVQRVGLPVLMCG